MPLRLTRNQVREIDRRSMDDYHIPGIVLMENAARAVADQAWPMMRDQSPLHALIICGGGNNGGDGYAAARHLVNLGARVTLLAFTDPSRLRGDAQTNYRIAAAMRIEIKPATVDAVLAHRGLIIDAIFGTGLNEAPRHPFSEIADAINHGGKVLSVDVPSGLDCDTGMPLGRCVKAAATVTFVAEKVGFANPLARSLLGTVVVGDIGCPRQLIEDVARLPL